jgi:pimeloyl-ACP methyl ester carboxylesterase
MDGYTITLNDGRKLGFCEYGNPDGIPLMLFHGTPGSRLMPRLEKAAWIKEFNLRVITPERPGFGLSDPAPGRSISDWASDVEELADHLGLERYHVAGGSGGGPYALACAIASPQRVISATPFASGGPPEVMRLTKDMDAQNRIIFFLVRYLPCLARRLLRAGAKTTFTKPEKVKAVMLKKLTETNQAVGQALDGDNMLKSLQEAYRQGGDGAYHDLRLVGRDWKLDLGKIEIPVFLWHGTADILVPVSTARGLARLIPGCEAHFIPDAGHLLLGSEAVASQMISRMLAAGA